MDANKVKRVFLFGLGSYFQELLQEVDSINPTSKARGQIEQLYLTLLAAAAGCTPTVIDRNNSEPSNLPVTPGTDFYFRMSPLVHQGPMELIGILAQDVSQLPESCRASVGAELRGAPEPLLPTRLLSFVLTRGEGVVFQRSMLLATRNRKGSFIPVAHSFRWWVGGKVVGGKDLTETAGQEADRLFFLLDLVLREGAARPSGMPPPADEKKNGCRMIDPTHSEMMLRQLEKELPDVDLFSREFLFDKKHALSRSKVMIFGSPCGFRSRLSFLLRDAIPDERRKELFPGDYDLGNLRSPLAKPSSINESPTERKISLADELTQDLWNEGKLSTQKALDANNFKKINQDLAALTGRSMKQHYASNDLTALKVVKLLYRLGRDRWSSNPLSTDVETGKSQLFDLLKWPEANDQNQYSLSLRDMFPYQSPSPKSPYKASEDVSALLADLKSYLSVELNDETYQAISEVPQALHWHLNNVERNIEKLLIDTGRTRYWEAVKTYNYLANRINLEPKSFDVPVAEIALDEELFLYLHLLEFAHFAEAYPRLLEKAEPNCVLVPIGPAFDVFASDLTENEAAGMFDPMIKDDDFCSFINTRQKMFRRIVGAALHEEISKSALEKSITPALHLAQTYAFFRKQPFGEIDPSTFSFLEMVAALCCVLTHGTDGGAFSV